MQTRPEPLEKSLKELKRLLQSERELSDQKDQEITQLKQQYQNILEQFRLAQHKQFGQSSEVSPDQQSLFNEAEALAEVTLPEKESASVSRQKPKRKALPKTCPVRSSCTRATRRRKKL